MICLNKKEKNVIRLIKDFGEHKVAEIVENYFNSETPDYDTFIRSNTVKKELNFLTRQQIKDELNFSGNKELFPNQEIKLKKLISNRNNKIYASGKNYHYRLYNLEYANQAGTTKTWGVRRMYFPLDMDKKIEKLESDPHKNSQKIAELQRYKTIRESILNTPFPTPEPIVLTDTQQAEQVQIEDAKRAGMEYNDEYLFYQNSNQVNYSLKAVEILQSDKAKQVFAKGKKNNWDLNKILSELQIPKEQKQIILDKYNDSIAQDNNSYYRGQIEEPTIDEEGNLILYGKEDNLYKRAGLKSKGVSMTDDLKTAIEYGNGQLEVAQNVLEEEYGYDVLDYEFEDKIAEIQDSGYWLIQIPKNISNEVVKEAGEVKIIGDTLVVPKGQFKVEQINDEYIQNNLREPEQIHILGSKQDIEGFKSWMKSNTKTVRNKDLIDWANFIPNEISSEEQIKEQISIPEFNELEKKLKEFLGKYGFSIQGLDDYIEGYELRTGKKFSDSPIALIDLFKKVIAVDANKMDETTLPEEVGHLAEALLSDNSIVLKLRELVSSHPDYQEIYDEYYPLYKKLNPNLTEEQIDTKVRREAIGKLIAKELINQTKNENLNKKDLNFIERFIRVVKKMLDLFFRKLNKAEQLNIYISKIANSILEQDSKMFNSNNLSPSGEIFYQNSNSQDSEDTDKTVGPLGKAIKSLQDRIKSIKRSHSNDENFDVNTDKRIKKLRDMIYDLKKSEKDNLIKEGASIFVNNAISEIEKIIDILYGTTDDEGNILTTARELNKKELNDLNDFIAYTYLPTKQLKHILRGKLKNNEEDIELSNTIDKVISELDYLSEYHNQKIIELGLSTVKEFMDKEENDLTERGNKLLTKKKDTYKDYINNKISDIGTMSKFFGELRSTSNVILNALYEKIDNVIQKIRKETYDWSKSLINEVGDINPKDLEKFYEVDENGKSTGYFNRPQSYRKYFKERSNFLNTLYKKYNLSENRNERNEQLRNDKKLAEKFNKEKRKWIVANTDRSITDIELRKLYDKNKKKMSKKDFRHWVNRNVSQSDKTGEIYLNDSLGDYRTPKMSKYKNKDWDKIQNNKKLLDFYNKIIELKKEIDSNLPPSETSLYRIPQLSKTLLDRFKSNSSIKTEMKELLKEKFLTRVDDTEFGEREILKKPDGSQQKLIPIFYTQLLEDTNDLSRDLIGVMVAYKEMQSHFTNMSKINPDIELHLDYIKTLKFDDDEKLGTESNVYSIAKDFVDAMVYHTKQKELTTDLFGMLHDKKLSLTKVANNIASWVRHSNLVGNLFTSVIGYFSAESWKIAEGITQEHISSQSLIFAENELIRNSLGVLNDSLKMKKNNKVSLLIELSGIEGSAKELFKDFDKSRTERGILEVPYASYSLADYKIKSNVLIGLLHDTRIVNNEWINKREYLKKGLDAKQWDSYKTAYDSFEIKNGVPTLNIPENIQFSIFKKARSIVNRIDGQLSDIDKGMIHRSVAGQFLVTHRNWLLRGVQDRFTGIKYDSALGNITEGSYRTIGRLVIETIQERKLNYLLANWNNLEDFEKKNVYRVLTDLATLLILNVIGFILQGAAEGSDDDEWLIQSASYVANRMILEQAALMPIGISFTSNFIPAPVIPGFQELAALLQNPIPATSLLRNITDLATLFNFKEIESGKYEGMNGFTKTIIRMTPGVNGGYNSMFPAEKNKWLKGSALTSFYWIE